MQLQKPQNQLINGGCSLLRTYIGRRDEEEEKEPYSIKREPLYYTMSCITQTLQISELNFYLQYFYFTLIGYLKHEAF